jgi:electron transfer flavoprotein alpha subunit
MTSLETVTQPRFRGVMVYLEQTAGRFEKVSLEMLGKAQELAEQLSTQTTGVVLGHNVGELAEEAIQYGADGVLVADSKALENYTTEAFSNLMGKIVAEKKPEVLLLGATHDGRDLAGRLAVRLNTGLMAHAVQVNVEKDTKLLVCGVPGFGGSLVAICKCPKSRPQMATVRPGIFPIPRRDPKRQGSVEQVPVDLAGIRTRVIERSVKDSVDVTKADTVIIAGRGAEAQLEQVRKFAESVGGVVGVTRPLADKGLAVRDSQIGSTGCAVSPKLAIVLGASGAAHFVSGIREAKTVVSINKDANAAINAYADYIVVDQIEKVLPVLMRKFKK